MRRFIQRKEDDSDSDPFSPTKRSIVFKKEPGLGDESEEIKNIDENRTVATQTKFSSRYATKVEKQNQFEAKKVTSQKSEDGAQYMSTVERLRRSIELARNARKTLSCRVTDKSKIIEEAQENLNQKKQELKTILDKASEIQNGKLSATESQIMRDISVPLNVIKQQVDLISLNHNNFDDRIKLDSLDGREKVIKNISTQINNVLEFIKQPKYQFKLCDITEMIKSSINEIEIPQEISVTVPQSPFLVQCDEAKIKSVIQNIITNAVQAVGYSGQVIVSAREENNYCMISIQDSGHGIPENRMEKIFEPMYTTKIDGSGLGLASCKDILAYHGGSISVQNNPTTFTIKIPKTVK